MHKTFWKIWVLVAVVAACVFMASGVENLDTVLGPDKPLADGIKSIGIALFLLLLTRKIED